MVNPLEQYPDVLQYTQTTGGGSHYDDDGNLVIDPPTTTVVEMICRAEANVKGQYLIGVDGAKVEYAWYILLDIPVPVEVPYGATINVYREGVLRATGTVKRFVVDPLDAKIWV